MNDTIYLNQLHTRTVIGILPYERTRKQTLVISLALETDFTAVIASGDLKDTLDYASLAEFVTHFSTEARYELLEAFAGGLVDAIMQRFNVDAVTVTLQKPGALEQTREVGLKMRRERRQTKQLT